MRAPQYSRSGQVAFNMTPMIDIVFLLIIFFLLSSHLARRESHMQLPLPMSETGEEVWEETAPRVTLNVLADGRVLLAGRVVTGDELSGRLSRTLRESGEDLEVRIRADRQVTYRHIGPLLVAAAEAGIWNVKFAVIRGEDAGR